MSRVPAIALAIALACQADAFAQKRAFTIEDLYRVTGIGGFAVSPDERSIVYAVTTTDLPRAKRTSKLWMIGADGANARQITFGAGNESDASFSPDGQWLSFVSTRDGSGQIYVMPTTGGEARKVTSISTGVSTPVWTPDSKAMVFATDVYPECNADDACNKKIAERWEGGPLKAHMADELLYRHWTDWRDGKRTHLVRVDVASGAVRDLTPGNDDSPPFSLGGPTPFAFSPDGREFVFESKRVKDQALSTNNDLFRISLEVESTDARNLTPDNLAFDGSPVYSPDGRYLAYRVQQVPNYESDLFRLALLDRQTGLRTVVTESFRNWIDGFQWTPDSKAIVFQAQVEGNTPLYRFDIATNAITRVLERATIDHFELVNGGRDVVFTSRSVGRPVEMYRATLGSASAPRQLTKLNDALIDEVDVRPAETMWVTAADGARIHVFIVKPTGFDPAKKYPLVLNVHGGPQQMWGDAFRGDWQVYPGAGYVVAFPNPRGSVGYGQEFTAQISGDYGGKVFGDLMAVTDALEQLPYVDKDRMGAMGWSFGGYMMNWFAGHTTRFKTLASMMGMYNNASFWGATEELWFPEWDFKGTPWTSEQYVKVSPSTYATSFKTPMLVLTGERDYRVPYTESLQLFTALQRQGIPSRLIVFPNAGHWPSWYEMALYYTAHLEWFQKYLGGGAAPWTTEQFLRNAVFDRSTGARIP
ncbi:MAG: S9 family peptidase [Acidobacteria bacterium]|nr:S9 family peptidase [Acidobacteriota bacterium]